jgi:hypothetical protein
MVSELLPLWHSPSSPSLHGRPFRQCGAFFCFRNGVLGTAIFSAISLVGLVCYVTLLTPRGHLLFRPPEWNGPSQHPNSVYTSTSLSPSASPSPTPSAATPSFRPPSLIADELTLKQIRDIVTLTRGFYSRDYSVHLGWNNVGVRGSQI